MLTLHNDDLVLPTSDLKPVFISFQVHFEFFSVPKLRELPQEAISEIADVLEEVHK